MEEVLAVTKSDITKAFQLYNEEYLKTPESYGEIDSSVDVATRQADEFIRILKIVLEEK